MKKQILVVEDDEDILGAIHLALTDKGYAVEVTPDSDEAIAMAEKHIPDLIILDLLLSGGDGREICDRVRSTRTLKQIPVLIMSAHPSAEAMIRETEVDAFLSKPFDLHQLLSTIRALT